MRKPQNPKTYTAPDIEEDFDITAESDTPPTPMKAAPSEQPPVADELPNDLRLAIGILTRLDNTETGQMSRSQQVEHLRRLHAIKSHVYALQQMPVAPEITADVQAQGRATSTQRRDLMAQRITGLKALLNR